MDTNAANYLRALNAVCRQLFHGSDTKEVEQAIRALRAMNPNHALLPAVEAKVRHLKTAIDRRSDRHETPAAWPHGSM